MEHISTIATSLLALKDSPVALISFITCGALAVCAYAIHAVIVALKHRGDKS